MAWTSVLVVPFLAACPASPPAPKFHTLPPSAAPVYDWPERKDSVDREPDHPAEEQGTLVLGVGASASGFSNVTAHHLSYQNDYTSIASRQFLPEQFLNMPRRTNLQLRADPKGQHSLRRAVSRRMIAARTGR
ncbi:MAG: hypothetical protein WAM78_16855 [Candidatus Sulfotelmatobacter sp.]